MSLVRFVIPKGHLEERTFTLLRNAGYDVSQMGRTYRPGINDARIELKLQRPQEIPVLVAEGLHDVGITGRDWISETEADVETLLPLEYGRVTMIMAAPKAWSDVDSLADLLSVFNGRGKNVRISTEYLNTTRSFLKSNARYREFYDVDDPLVITPWWRTGSNPHVSILLSFGATEAKPPESSDAIVDVVETGMTLEQNNLKIIEELAVSQAVLIANREALHDPSKREKIHDIATLLHGVVEGDKKLHIFVNVREEHLAPLIERLPALKGPTVSRLSSEGWYSLNTVIDRRDFLELLPDLRRLAQGLVVHDPRQILTLEGDERNDR
jgi:ATP phosphoribosyltransferase